MPSVHTQGVVPTPCSVGMLHRRRLPTASAHEGHWVLQGKRADVQNDGAQAALEFVELQRLGRAPHPTRHAVGEERMQGGSEPATAQLKREGPDYLRADDRLQLAPRRCGGALPTMRRRAVPRNLVAQDVHGSVGLPTGTFQWSPSPSVPCGRPWKPRG